MYALDANSITGHKALVRFLSEHSAALIKPDLINSDKGRKIEGAKERELEEIYNPDGDLTKKGLVNCILASEATADRLGPGRRTTRGTPGSVRNRVYKRGRAMKQALVNC